MPPGSGPRASGRRRLGLVRPAGGASEKGQGGRVRGAGGRRGLVRTLHVAAFGLLNSINQLLINWCVCSAHLHVDAFGSGAGPLDERPDSAFAPCSRGCACGETGGGRRPHVGAEPWGGGLVLRAAAP